mgnify:CR=1 FL=1
MNTLEIKAWIADIREANELVGNRTITVQVRDVKLANAIGARQLRTKKNRYVAAIWTELDVHILTRGGKSRQLYHNEYEGA